MGVLSRSRPAVDLGKCQKCRAAGGGPFVWRGNVFATCDTDRLRWRINVSAQEASALNIARLHYVGVDR